MDNLFHDNMLWPTVVVLPKRTGWSLWGGNADDGSDFLLPVGPRYALFDTADGLCDHVRRDGSAHVLSQTFGWAGLRKGLRGPTPDVSEACEFRLDRLAKWSPHEEESAGGLVDCLDLIRDLGRQFDDALLTDLSEPGGALRQLYDNLWGELWGDAPKLHPERVAKAAKQAVARVATLATWNPAA
ncbi:hypothetical protein [Dactylosporangium sp. NPDC006015]|uniref:hypothetical protein n=1 Tax=Dactylosporangium sp. NPDC006015 TaxID=3154576 RepID=UPI0033B6E093